MKIIERNLDEGIRIWLNLRREWTLAERETSEEPIDLITLGAHEAGHAIGMEHTFTSKALMNPHYSGSHRFLAFYDISFYKYLYYNDERPPTSTLLMLKR